MSKVNFFILLGGGLLLAESACFLKESGVECRVIISPRHEKEISEILVSHSIAYISTNDWKSVLTLRDHAAMENGMAISFGAPWIFKQEDIDHIFLNKLYNVHGSRLPTFRGGGFFSWQVLRDCRYGFCILHQIDSGVDTGPIVACEEFLYPSFCRIPADYMRVYREKNILFLKELFTDALNGRLRLQHVIQMDYLSQYWPRLDTNTDGWIDWSLSLNDLDAFIRAFDDPYPGALTEGLNQTLRIKKTSIDTNDGQFHPLQQGIVYRNNGRWACVASRGGTLIVEKILNSDEQNILPVVKVGTRLSAPQNYVTSEVLTS